MATNPFQTIRTNAGDTKRSIDWYQSQIKNLTSGSIRPNRLMTTTPGLTSRIMPGKMYMFFYDAKHKEKLPFWDAFPLTLPFRKVDDGFFGINLHYLPYMLRFKLLGALHEYAINEQMTEDNRLRINWRILNNMSRIAPIQACVKHYLYEHVQSKFLDINYPDWVVAALLPVERFEGATKQNVWTKTRERR